jgi:type II secretory pathway pseudopilin PulG
MPALDSRPRAAFTLTELLIVITIIIVLAGLLMPALGMVKAQANEVKCESNMRQIAMAVELYRQNADQNFPGSFEELVALYNLPPKVLLCPLDASHGTDVSMGRASTQYWSDNYARLYYQAIGSTSVTGVLMPANQQPALTSYDFEANGKVDTNVCTGPGTYPAPDDIGFFYRDNPNNLPPSGTVSWADCKLHEQANCNVNPSNLATMPFPTGAVPILRCYHHWDWTKAASKLVAADDKDPADYPSKVVNLSLDFGVIKTTPYWEVSFNHAIENKWPP